jgi:hypothetical protein
MPTVPSSGSGSGSYISARQVLREKVAALKGFSVADPNLVERVDQFLDDAVKDLNTYPWESAKTSETFALTLDQQYVTLNPLFFKESLVYLTHITSGNYTPMKGLPYVHFKRLYPMTSPNQTIHGTPTVYTIFNYEKTRRLQFDIAPDTNTVTNFSLIVEYYKRLPLISSTQGETSADIPDYFENTILYGAYKRMCAHLGDDSGVQVYSGLEREALERLQRIDIMHPDAERRFRLIDELSVSPNYGYSIYPF